MQTNHPYSLFHALMGVFLTIGILIGIPINMKGFKTVWEFFLYGSKEPMTAEILMESLLSSSVVFAIILLMLWGMGRFLRSPADLDGSGEVTVPSCAHRREAVLTAVKFAPLLTLIALGLNFLGGHVIAWVTHREPYEQVLVTCFTNGSYSLGLRALLVLIVLLQAPLLEEPIFRGVLFRGFSRVFSVGMAMGLSGVVFAIVHLHAASFVALWFLGMSFAWLYHRTGSILAPITAHFIFNGTNLVLLFLFPDLVSHS